VHIVYLVSATNNLLYEGRYQLGSRYQTYGQHSFIYDLVVSASRRGIKISLLVQGLDRFPLSSPLAPYCDLTEVEKAPSMEQADLILIDVIPEPLIRLLPPSVPAFCVVHNASMNYSEDFQVRCNRFLCMTEVALRHLSKRLVHSKAALIHQGVDMQRFRPKIHDTTLESGKTRVLIYSRMNSAKQRVVSGVVENLIPENVELTVLGDGDAFWHVSDRFGTDLTLINHIPCHSIHRFLLNYHVIISSGRGAMEGLASGVPVLCAGLGYGGPVLPENIRHLLKRNLTGYGLGCETTAILSDLSVAMSLDWRTCRRMAEDYCSADRFIDQLIEVYASL
jgi:glycosyltransferase involved in cell wall biosynthesis